MRMHGLAQLALGIPMHGHSTRRYGSLTCGGGFTVLLLQNFFIDSNAHSWWSFKELTITNGYILLIVLTRTNDRTDFPFPHLYYITWFEKKLSVIRHHWNLFSKCFLRIWQGTMAVSKSHLTNQPLASPLMDLWVKHESESFNFKKKLINL